MTGTSNIRGLVLSHRPPIFVTETYALSPFLGDASKIASLISGMESTIFIVPAATLLNKGASESGAAMVAAFRDQYPNIRLIVLANETAEENEAALAGLEAIHINQNAFLDENVFVTNTDASKRFNAVYNAQMLPFKRHHLAEKINSLALIYYGTDLSYFEKVKLSLPMASFINGDPRPDRSPNGNLFRFISPKDITEIYATSRVGLCLSAREGAMYASGEYLLCGLPVVSTENVGGRNDFLDDYNCLYCRDDPLSVAEAVDLVKTRDVDPEKIRADFLNKALSFRQRFFTAIDQIRAEYGFRNSDFASEFMSGIFRDKLWKTRTPERIFIELGGNNVR